TTREATTQTTSKKLEERGAEAPELEAWKNFSRPPFRYLVPSNYPVLCTLPIDRPIFDYDLPDEPLLGLLPPVSQQLSYGPTVWGVDAYKKSFEKFTYAIPSDFETLYPVETRFADWAWNAHFSYLDGTKVCHITATDKNLDSTPAYPKFLDYQTERDFLETNGWRPYVETFKAIDAGARPHVLWYMFLKKEILSEEKISNSDIRQIICADPIYARIGACFEQHQNNLMKKKTTTSSGQCGWSPFYGGFNRMCHRLASKRGTFVEFDWTRFDGTIPTSLFMRIKKLRFLKLDKKHQLRYQHIYAWYCRNLVRRFVLLPSGEVTMQKRGNPSGQISTTMDNNLVNFWLQAFEFCYFFGPNKDLWSDYDTVVYGDDRLSRYPILPDDYIARVVTLYKDVFGMWVKPEKVRTSDTLVGLTFCGFTIGPDFQPYPTNTAKLWAGLVKPTKKLKDIYALHGKLLSLQLLCYWSKDETFKSYLEACLSITSRFVPNLPPRLTDQQMLWLWRGGPKALANG
ncbi:RNA-dependent RNA polymerase, partial [Marmot astrovirus 3]